MDNAFYFEKCYPLQDGVLRVITDTETGFCLTGGTAASRAYLHHRFSDDLDLFVNDDERFGLWTDRIIQALLGTASLAVDRRDERFVRTLVTRADLSLRIEMVNDTPAHVGVVTLHETLGRLDSAENILANKITALIDRDEPKDDRAASGNLSWGPPQAGREPDSVKRRKCEDHGEPNVPVCRCQGEPLRHIVG